ncbi:MAG TPA: DUF5715 family protein [Spirochaetota bacterium]|nr:DUF5715 family protein [Spirochaetota bacterium]
MKRREAIIIILSIIAVVTTAITSYYAAKTSAAGYVKKYTDACYEIERGYIESIPVFRDYATPALVAELQKYNLAAHGLQVVKTGINPMHNEKEIMENVKNGKLAEVKSDNEFFYFHNVQKQYRYLTPGTIRGLRLVTERFQQKIKAHRDGLPQVKIAISSVIRTVDYQEKIFGRKFVSVHSYGGCFDIFFDDYFVVVPDPETGSGIRKSIGSVLHTRFGFLMGDALREQFRTILMETLIELQREGVLYVFLEDDRRCYHITILPVK